MAPTVTLLRKTMVRGRGPQRIRALVQVTFAANHVGAYTAGTGFEDAAASGGVDIQGVLPDIILNQVGSMVEPRMTLLASWTNFTTVLLGTVGLLDFKALTVTNYGTKKKLLKVCLYGVKAGPVFDEASTDAGGIDGGSFVVELEYTPNSGAEA